MHPAFGHILGRLTRLLPNTTRITTDRVAADFFLPSFDHHIGKDLRALRAGAREPRLYDWIENFTDGSVFFDVGTHHGQEAVWAACQRDKTIHVTGFDCGLLQSHFCALNSALNRTINGQNFDFVFAAVGATSGEMIPIEANSDTHIPRLHKKNAPYLYQVPSVALDDYAAQNNLSPTHLKIDVDGAEAEVIAGAATLLAGDVLQEIFIEIDPVNKDLADVIKTYGFHAAWERHKPENSEYLFVRG